MKLFFAYIRERQKEMIALVLFGAIFAVSFLLYHLPIGAVGYPALLCLLFGIIFVIIDFIHVRARHEQLCEIREMTAAMISQMPAAEGIEDTDYQAVIESLITEVTSLQTDTDARYQDMVEYYTVWVHQIKTPIASMRLTLQNEDSELSRKLSSDLFRIEQYVEMVLAFLRLGASSSDYVFKEYELDDIIRQAVRRFSAEFIGRKLRLEYEPLHKSIVTDDKWLSFVVEQVLSNALKYTRSGGIRIYMSGSDTLCIEDTGIGIAPEDLPRVFEKGYTGYNGRSDKRASGIGLYLCKRICKNLGIEITAASQVGKGTVISLNIGQYKLKQE